MDPALRAELDRIHADTRALRMLLARIAARHFDRAELLAWNERVVARIEVAEQDAEARAILIAAIDRLMPTLLKAEADLRNRPPD